MPMRAVTVVGAAGALLAAVLGVVLAARAGGWLAATTVAAGALGLGALAGVVVAMLRTLHRQLRELRADAKQRAAGLERLEGELAALTGDDGEVARLRAGLADDLDARHEQLLRTVDARVLGIHASLRELAGVEDERGGGAARGSAELAQGGVDAARDGVDAARDGVDAARGGVDAARGGAAAQHDDEQPGPAEHPHQPDQPEQR